MNSIEFPDSQISSVVMQVHENPGNASGFTFNIIAPGLDPLFVISEDDKQRLIDFLNG